MDKRDILLRKEKQSHVLQPVITALEKLKQNLEENKREENVRGRGDDDNANDVSCLLAPASDTNLFDQLQITPCQRIVRPQQQEEAVDPSSITQITPCQQIVRPR